jgi:hypothetical protein
MGVRFGGAAAAGCGMAKHAGVGLAPGRLKVDEPASRAGRNAAQAENV